MRGGGLEVILGEFICWAPDDGPAVEEAHLPDGFESFLRLLGSMSWHAFGCDADEFIRSNAFEGVRSHEFRRADSAAGWIVVRGASDKAKGGCEGDRKGSAAEGGHGCEGWNFHESFTTKRRDSPRERISSVGARISATCRQESEL